MLSIALIRQVTMSHVPAVIFTQQWSRSQVQNKRLPPYVWGHYSTTPWIIFMRKRVNGGFCGGLPLRTHIAEERRDHLWSARWDPSKKGSGGGSIHMTSQLAEGFTGRAGRRVMGPYRRNAHALFWAAGDWRSPIFSEKTPLRGLAQTQATPVIS